MYVKYRSDAPRDEEERRRTGDRRGAARPCDLTKTDTFFIIQVKMLARKGIFAKFFNGNGGYLRFANNKLR